MTTLSAHDIVYDVSAGCHVAVCRFTMGNVYDVIKKEGFAMLTAETLEELVSEEWDNSRELTLLMMSSWLARCALQSRQP